MKQLFIPIALSLLLAACAPEDNTIEGLETFTVTQGHKEGRVAYPTYPPTGGEHNPAWQNCGIYETQVGTENAVHSLEHGAVWITYQPNLAAEEIKKLREVVKGRSYALVSPSPFGALSKPIYAVAWGVRVGVDSADDKRLKTFIRVYMQSKLAPEPGASCSGAIGNPIQ
ncbi:MAG: hypothetical protein RLZZ156_200 [Deinococcota bacterium]|jgi:hypothetical protein